MQEGFLTWFYSKGLGLVVKVWLRVTALTFDTFSIGFLGRSLFAPWKRDVTAHVNASLQQIFEDLSFNLISRLVGAVIRAATIVTGLIITAFVFVIGGLISFLTLLVPVALLPTYNYLKRQTQPLRIEPLSELVKHPEIKFILKHAGIDGSTINTQSEAISADQLLKEAEHFAKALRSVNVRPAHLLIAYFELNPTLKQLLVQKDLLIEELAEIVAWQQRLWHHFEPVPIFVNPDQIRASTRIGLDWAAGFTPHLNRFAKLITEPRNTDYFLAHRQAVTQVETILGRAGKHNVLLVGDPGVGKSTIIRALASRFGDSRKIFSLNVTSLVSGLTMADDFETRLVGALNDAVQAGNVTLYIEDIEILLDQTKSSLNAVAILEPFLESPNLELIATTTFANYHNLIDADPILAKSFERVDIVEPSGKQVMIILEDLVPTFESRSKSVITYQAVREIVKVADRFMGSKRFPEKAIDILDEITSQISGQIINAAQIDTLISAKTHIKIGEPLKQERELLLNLEAVLHKRLVNQEQAIKEIADALRRVRAGVIPPNKPIGSFLFLGPTGVGKTETAKALAENYFSSEQAMVRFDMSEYQSSESSQRLMANLSARISQQPFTLLLLDEIEKAYPDILNLFLQVLDEAKMTSQTGQNIDFRNTIIIATSNAGSEFIRESASNQKPVTSNQLLDYVQKQGVFKPEFLNRFTAVVAYHPLTQDQLKQVVDILLARINKTLKERQITVALDDAAKTKLAKLGFDPAFGARALERTMRAKVENLVANKVLKGELAKGQTLTISQDQI